MDNNKSKLKHSISFLSQNFKEECIYNESISVQFDKYLSNSVYYEPVIPKYELISYINKFNKNSCVSYGGSLPTTQMSQVPAVIVQSSLIWRYDKYVDPKVLSQSSSFQKLMKKNNN
jgi:hypothetical protein